MRPALLATASLLAGCQAAVDASTTRPVLERCHVPGVDAETRCGTYTVHEDREAGAGRTIDLRVVVVPAVRPDPEPDPVFFLAGGPGQAASEVIGVLMPAFRRVQQRRDLVFVDQRGTGSSNGLDCEAELEPSLAEIFETEVDLDETIECRDALTQRADLTKYTTPLAMDDLDDVRAWLGYDRINLYGASYGTRAGLVYARRHPESVRTLMLDGLAPTDMRLFLDFGPDGQRALDRTLADCEAEVAGCGEAFPNVRAELAGLLARDAETPPAEVAHPRTGAAEDVPLAGPALAGAIRGALYQPHLAALLPLAIHEAAQDRWEPFIALTAAVGGSTSDGMSMGMMLSVACAEDQPRFTDADRAAAATNSFLGDTLVDTLDAWCGEWPTASVPDGYNAPVAFDGPALLLSGDLDPVTPPSWGVRAGQHLPQSLHVVAPGSGHNVAMHGCIPSLIADFVEAGSAADLDVTCAADIQRPPFFVDFAGPAL